MSTLNQNLKSAIDGHHTPMTEPRRFQCDRCKKPIRDCAGPECVGPELYAFRMMMFPEMFGLEFQVDGVTGKGYFMPRAEEITDADDRQADKTP